MEELIVRFSAAAPSPEQLPLTSLQNTLLAAAAGGPVVLLCLPAIVWLCCRKMETIMKMFSTPSMVASILNSILWLLYTTVVMEKEDCIELVLAYPLVLAFNFIYLMFIYGHLKSFIKASLLGLIVIPSLLYIFWAIRLQPNIPKPWEKVGFAGLGMLLASHVCLVSDVVKVAGFIEYLVAFTNIIPNTALSASTVFVIVKSRWNQPFVFYSGMIGTLFGVMELLLLLKKIIEDRFYGAGAGQANQPNQNAANPVIGNQNAAHPVAENQNVANPVIGNQNAPLPQEGVPEVAININAEDIRNAINDDEHRGVNSLEDEPEILNHSQEAILSPDKSNGPEAKDMVGGEEHEILNGSQEGLISQMQLKEKICIL